MKKWFVLCLIVSLIAGAQGYAAYNRLRTKVNTALPESVRTVGEAAQYYASVAGYTLVTDYPAPAESRQIADEEINTMSFTAQLLSIDDAILYLLREPYELVVDHEHGLFSFQIKEENGGNRE